MKYIKKYKIFENNIDFDYIKDDIEDILLDVRDEDIEIHTEYNESGDVLELKLNVYQGLSNEGSGVSSHWLPSRRYIIGFGDGVDKDLTSFLDDCVGRIEDFTTHNDLNFSVKLEVRSEFRESYDNSFNDTFKNKGHKWDVVKNALLGLYNDAEIHNLFFNIFIKK
jgi:hypothetical protein